MDRKNGKTTDRSQENPKIDPFGFGRSCRKPIVTAVQGITYTFGIEVALAGDIIIAADMIVGSLS